MSSGESTKIREAMDRFTGRLIQGGVAPEKARKIAQEQAQKADRRERDKR